MRAHQPLARAAVVASALLVACTLLATAYASFQEVEHLDYSKVQSRPYSEVSWRLTSVNTIYHHQDDSTSFTYQVETGANDLGHFFLVTSCASPAPILSKNWAYTVHPTTGQTGVRYFVGQAKGTTETYTLRVKGKVKVNPAGSFIVLGGMVYATSGPVPVPDCVGSPINGQCTTGGADATVDCSQQAQLQPPTGRPYYDRTEKLEGPCVYTYTLNHYFRQPFGTAPNTFNECVQRISVVDNQPPQASMNDSYLRLSCGDPIPPVPEVIFTDNCDPAPSVNYCEERQNGTCPGEFIITRTWTATDSCGNSKCITQTLAWVDMQAPALIGVPANTEYECAPGLVIAPPPTVTAFDYGCDCFLFGGVLYSEERYPGDCPGEYMLVRTWNITDCCGNFNSSQQVISVLDRTPPAMQVPLNNTIACDVLFVPPPVVAQDVCSGDVAAEIMRTRTNFSCPATYMLTHTYSAQDDCGNMVMQPSYILVTNPYPISWVAASLPPNQTVTDCRAIPLPANVQATHPCLDVTVTVSESREPGPCPSQFAIIRRWLATTVCNQSLEYVQRITVSETQIPLIDNSSLPFPGPFQCADQVPSLASMLALARPVPSDSACPEPVNITGAVTRIDGSCVNDFVMRYTFFAGNCPGLSSSLTREVRVHDTVPPVLHGVPANVSVPCTSIPAPATGVTASDNCDETVPVTMNQTTVPGSCPGAYTILRVWHAVDLCGNAAAATQYIFVSDSVAPVFASLPPHITVPCDNVPNKTQLVASDDCTLADVDHSIPDEHRPGSCPNDYFLIRRWVARDECANTVTHTQTVHVVDTQPPVFQTYPNDTDASCLDVPLPGDVCVADNCEGLTVAFTETRGPADCPNNVLYTLIRRWVATDACGNTATHSQTVRIVDTTMPSLPQQPNLVQPCDNVQLPENPVGSHPCLNVTLETHHSTVPGQCPQNYTLLRSFRAVDSCGRGTWMNYSISVVDTVPPVLTVPADITNASCVVPPVGAASATDNCDPNPTVEGPVVTRVDGSCPLEYRLLRVWTARDACGNSVSATQTVHFVLREGPHWVSPLPADASFQCVPDDPATLSAADECGTPLAVLPASSTSSATCPRIITRTWTATDSCGRAITHTQIVTVHDTVPPVLELPANGSVYECVAPLPPVSCGTDNCPGLDIEFTEDRLNDVCVYEFDLLRRWTLRDACGNTVSGTNLVRVRDDAAPVFSRQGLNRTFTCALGPISPPTATDNCQGAVPVTNETTVFPGVGACFRMRIVYTAADSCGNSASVTDWYEVVDSSPPVFQHTPALVNLTVECLDVPPFPVTNLLDNCAAQLSELAPQWTNTSCPYIFTMRRGVAAVDGCGNTAVAIQEVRGVHTARPLMFGLPANTSVPCETVVPVAEVTCTDSCGVPIMPAFATVLRNGSCAGEYTLDRLWTCTDQCGLVSSHLQVITFFNPEGPVTEPLAPIEFVNLCETPSLPDPSANTSCAVPVEFLVTNQTEFGACPQEFNSTLTYVFTDECGRTTTVQRVVSNTVTQPPEFINLPPTLVSYPCDAVLGAPALQATDFCGVLINATMTETRQPGRCPNEYNLTRTWRAVDACGLVETFVQRVVVFDTEPPKLQGVPSNKRVLCGFVPCPANVTASDNCEGVSVHFEELLHNVVDCCNYTIERRYVATDACGNSATGSYNITVYYNLPPTIDVPPGPPCIPCENFTGVLPPANVTAHAPPLAVGMCINSQISPDAECTPAGGAASPVELVYNSQSLTLNWFSESQVIQYATGNVSVQATLQDQNGKLYTLTLQLGGKAALSALPGHSPIKELKPACYGTGNPSLVDPSTWAYYPYLRGSLKGNGLDIALSAAAGQYAQFGLGANNRNREFGAHMVAAYSDRDSIKSMTMRLDVRPEGPDCVFDHSKFPQLDCNITLPITVTVQRFNGSCPQEFYFNRTFCVDSPLYPNHQVCGSQIIEICDDNRPTIQIPGSQTLECPAAPAPAVYTAKDLCDPNPFINVTETRMPGGCPGNYTLLRRYYAVDACGNWNTAENQIVVRDTTPPVLTGVPTTGGIVFCVEPPLPPMNATDTCGIDYALWPRIVSTRLPAPPGIPVCPQNYIRRVTITAEDLCGHRVSRSFDTLILNDRPPVLRGVPPAIVLLCNETQPTFNVTAFSECEGDLTARIVYKRAEQPGECLETVITHTWSVADSCGQSVTATSVVTVRNPFPPAFGPLPANMTVDCLSVPGVATVTASSVCPVAHNITFATYRVNGTCATEYTLFRVWTLFDCFGRFVQRHVQAIEVRDALVPVISPAHPAFVNATCRNVPLPPDVCAQGQCPGVSMDFREDKQQLHPNPECPRYTLTRTWTAISECGRTNSTQQVVRVWDDVVPVCSPAPANRNLSCTDPSEPTAPTCRDDCSNVTLSLDRRTLPGPQPCPESVIRQYTWTACDACGNCVTLQTNYTVVIDVPPQIEAQSDTVFLECLAPQPILTPNVSDPCFDLRADVVERVSNGTCNLGNTSVTYSAINDCGLEAVPIVVTYVYQDTQPPFFVGALPQNRSAPCDAVPSVEFVDAQDACGPVTIVFTNWTVAGPCPNNYTLWRRWVATDCVGHSITHLQMIRIFDNEPPVLTSPGPDQHLNCVDAIVRPQLSLTDNCPGGNISFVETRVNISNPLCASYDLRRTWTAVDACLNRATATQTVFVRDVTPPSCPPMPQPRTLSCVNASQAVASQPQCSDDCSGVKYSHIVVDTPTACPIEYTRTFAWRVEDNCGNWVWWNQSFVIVDQIRPVFANLPADKTVPCDALDTVQHPTASHPCGPVNVTFREFNNSQPNQCQNYSIFRVWVATDVCGLTESYTQTVRVVQTQPPTWVEALPQNRTLGCLDNFTAPELHARDVCGPTQVHRQETVVRDDGCTRVLRIDYTATNLCGYTIRHTFFVTFTDTVKPVLTPPEGFLPAITEECNATTLPPAMCCEDDCPGVTMQFNETQIPGSCPGRYTLHRRWTCLDRCGNAATMTQVVHVVDNRPPVFVGPLPQDELYECRNGSVLRPLQAVDNCGLATVNMTEQFIPGGCPANYSIVRRYIATDECGLQASHTQTVRVRQTTPPLTNVTEPLCFYSETHLDRLVIRNLTVPNTFFPAWDLCTGIHIAFVNCTSDEDAVLGSGCTYNAALDELYVSAQTTNNPLGRLYTVRALIINECGLTTPTMRQIFVPYNRSSITLRGFPFSPEECVPIRPECPDNCPCQTVDHICEEGAHDASLQYVSTTNDDTAGTSTFSYRLQLGPSGKRPNRVLLGVDLSQFELIGTTPSTNVTLGWQTGTYMEGIAWNDAATRPSDTYTFTIRGIIREAAVTPSVPYLLGGMTAEQDDPPVPCTTVGVVKGPARTLRPTFGASTVSLTGRVVISGARFGVDRTALVGVNEVPVALIDTAGRIVGVTLTDLNGGYTFRGLPSGASASWRLTLLEDGILRPAARSSGQFLRTNQYDILGQNDIVGLPHALSDTTFRLLLDNQEKPLYNRINFYTSFEGDAFPVNFWRYQLQGLGSLYGDFSQAQVNAWRTAAASLLTCPASIFSSNPLEANLAAAALNTVAGRGIFAPYSRLQGWILDWGMYVFCAPIANPTDRAIATDMLQRINRADDIVAAVNYYE